MLFRSARTWLDAYVQSELTFGPASVAELVDLFEPMIPDRPRCHNELRRALQRLFAAKIVEIDFTDTIPNVPIWRLRLRPIDGGRRGPAEKTSQYRPQHLRLVRSRPDQE